MLQKTTPVFCPICLLPVQTPHPITLVWVLTWSATIWAADSRIQLFFFIFLVLFLWIYLALIYRIQRIFYWMLKSFTPIRLRIWHLIWMLRYSWWASSSTWNKILKLLPCFHYDLVEVQIVAFLKLQINLWNLILKSLTSWTLACTHVFTERNLCTWILMELISEP